MKGYTLLKDFHEYSLFTILSHVLVQVYNVVTLAFKRPMPIWSKWIEGGNHVKHIRCPDNAPCPRGAQASTVSCGKLFVFGGYGGWAYNLDYLNDVCILDLETWEWSSPKIIGRGPSPRCGHKACTIHDGKLVVLGGCNHDELFSDMFLLEEQNKAYIWASLNVELPIPRSYFSLTNLPMDEDTIVVFGGMSQIPSIQNCLGSQLNDIHTIKNLNSHLHIEMTKLCNDENIEPRSDMDIVFIAKERSIVVFGGWGKAMYGNVHKIIL